MIVIQARCEYGHIDLVAEESRRVAKMLGFAIEFRFNGELLTVRPRDSREDVVAQYERKVAASLASKTLANRIRRLFGTKH